MCRRRRWTGLVVAAVRWTASAGPRLWRSVAESVELLGVPRGLVAAPSLFVIPIRAVWCSPWCVGAGGCDSAAADRPQRRSLGIPVSPCVVSLTRILVIVDDDDTERLASTVPVSERMRFISLL